jgi:hypothetical protein
MRNARERGTLVDSDEHDTQSMDALWEEVERASSAEDVSDRRRAIDAVIAKAKRLSEQTRTAPTLYMLGYAWYFHPDRASSQFIQDEVQTALRSALEVEPNYARAWMYLGHHAFDLGRYEEARRSFDRVELDQLGEYWRMKVFEMRLCCAIVMDGLSHSLPMMEQFVRRAEQDPPQDVWPSQLAKWVQTRSGTLGEVDKATLRQLAARIDRAGQFGQWFSSLF